MPIALAIASKAMGVTTQELMKMMEQGQLMANEFLPKFSKELRTAAREGDALAEGLKTSRIAMQRAGVAFNLNVLEAFDRGVEGGLSDFFNNIASVLKDTTPFWKVLGTAVGAVASVLGFLIKVGYQVIRPIITLVSAIVDAGKAMLDLATATEKSKSSTGELIEEISTLSYIFRGLAAIVVLPFAMLEYALDKVSAKMEKVRDGSLGLRDTFDQASLWGAKQVGIIGGAALQFAGLEDAGDAAFAMARRAQMNSDKIGMSASNSVTVNADIKVDGSGDPEAVARAVADTLNFEISKAVEIN